MSLTETSVLGAIAGLTIFLGLPLGRVKAFGPRARVGAAMFAVGVLAFLFVDVLSHGFAIVEHATLQLKDGHGSLGRAVGLALLLGGGVALGTAGLGFAESRMRRRRTLPPLAGGSVGALTEDVERHLRAEEAAADHEALRRGMTIAGAIGLHNFAEGLAIGVAAGSGEISLATVLIVGFALHNATEGLGIVGPLGSVRPSWRWLIAAGLIGGGPTFLGSMVGYEVNSQALELTFYAVAGGAILYVIGEIWHGLRRHGHRELGLALLSLGFFAGVVTDLVVTYGGG